MKEIIFNNMNELKETIKSKKTCNIGEVVSSLYKWGNETIVHVRGDKYECINERGFYDLILSIIHKDFYKPEVVFNYDNITKDTPIYSGNGVYNIRFDNPLAILHEIGHYLTARDDMRQYPNYGLGDDYMGGKAKIMFLDNDKHPFARMERDACIVEWLLLVGLVGEKSKKWLHLVADTMDDEGFLCMENTYVLRSTSSRIKNIYKNYKSFFDKFRYSWIWHYNINKFFKHK